MIEKIKKEVKDRLITGLLQYYSARSAGSTKFAISEGYLALDNLFTAILIEHGINPTKRHTKKLKLFCSNFGDILSKSGTSYEDLKDYYDWWQKTRYSTKTPSPGKTVYFLRLTRKILELILEEIGKRYGTSGEDLENELTLEIFKGYDIQYELDIVQETWQNKLECLGELGIGSKLINKIINPSNFSGLFIFSDDPIIHEIISEDLELREMIAKIYNDFLTIISHIFAKRSTRLVNPNDLLNFTFMLKLGYHGQSAEEIADDWTKTLDKIIDPYK